MDDQPDEAGALSARQAKDDPMPGPSELEIRPLYEAEDFGAEFTPELREQEDRLRERLGN